MYGFIKRMMSHTPIRSMTPERFSIAMVRPDPLYMTEIQWVLPESNAKDTRFCALATGRNDEEKPFHFWGCPFLIASRCLESPSQLTQMNLSRVKSRSLLFAGGIMTCRKLVSFAPLQRHWRHI